MKSERFVTDRCPIDLVHNWLNYRLHRIDLEASEAFVRRSIEECRKYDFVVVMPCNSIELKQEEGELPRNMNPVSQLRNHSNLLGYTHIWIEKNKIIEIPREVRSIEERVSWLDSVIRAKRPDLLDGGGQSC